MTGMVTVFVTAKPGDEARKIAQTVVEEGLAACANILPGVVSVYRWQGNVEEAEECALILKTVAEKFGVLEKRIRQLHSYECPCIVAWPIAAGSEDYLRWIKANT